MDIPYDGEKLLIEVWGHTWVWPGEVKENMTVEESSVESTVEELRVNSCFQEASDEHGQRFELDMVHVEPTH